MPWWHPALSQIWLRKVFNLVFSKFDDCWILLCSCTFGKVYSLFIPVYINTYFFFVWLITNIHNQIIQNILKLNILHSQISPSNPSVRPVPINCCLKWDNELNKSLGHFPSTITLWQPLAIFRSPSHSLRTLGLPGLSHGCSQGTRDDPT